MGEQINTDDGREYSPYVSPDGLYFFFMSTRPRQVYDASKFLFSFGEMVDKFSRPWNGNADIFWIDAGFIDRLRPESW